jgi:hypothetical protein
MPVLWSIAPLAWLAKVHDEALRVFGTDELRLYHWEEGRKLRGIA